MEFLLAVVLSFVPAFGCAALVYWLDRFEKEPKLLLGLVFFWGAVVAVIGAVIAQIALDGATVAISGSQQAADVAGSTIYAPVTEESLKGLAILLVFFFLRREFDSLLDGLVYAAVVALGFAATENAMYLAGAADEGGISGMLSLFVLRVGMGIWNHPLYTGFIGIGLAASRLSRSTLVRFAAPILGWAAACLVHGLHNGLAVVSESSPGFLLAMFLVDWGGWLFMGGLILWAIHREGRLLATHLTEEAHLGLINAGQYHTAISSWRRTGAGWRALSAGRWRVTRRFYKLCGELAHKKSQYLRFGDENGNVAKIQELRSELATLTGQVSA